MVRAILLGVALSACVSGPVLAQARPMGPAMATGEAYADIQSLKSEIAALKQQLAQQKADDDKQLFDARFRITVLEANQKQGGTTGQLSAQLNGLAVRITSLEASTGALNASLNALSSKFASHTHTYKMTSFGFGNHELLPPVHIGEEGLPRPTSPPN